MLTASYSPMNVNMFIDFKKLKYNADNTKMRVGAKGDVTLIWIADSTGTAEIILKQNSQMHAILTIAALAQKRAGAEAPLQAFSWTQGSNEIAFATGSILAPSTRDFPGSSDGKDEPICKWTFNLTSLSILT